VAFQPASQLATGNQLAGCPVEGRVLGGRWRAADKLGDEVAGSDGLAVQSGHDGGLPLTAAPNRWHREGIGQQGSEEPLSMARLKGLR
jgi:hypothetical protein